MKSFLNFSRFHKQIIAATADFLFLPITFVVAIWLRHDVVNKDLMSQYAWLIFAIPFISIPIFVRLGLYRAVIRFIDHKIVYVVVGGVSLSLVLLAALATFLHISSYSRGVFGIYWVSGILYVAASRFLARGYFLHASGANSAVGTTRVAIYGAGQAGIQLASALRSVQDYVPVAFIDDKKELQGATIGGIKVYPSNALADLIRQKKIKEVLLALPSQTRQRQKQILEKLEVLKIKIRVTPPIESLINGELRLQDVRDIEIEDLLGRDAVVADAQLISACITGKSVLVTGAGGSIGSELCRQIIALRPTRLVLLEMSEFALYSIKSELVLLRTALGIEAEVMPFLGSVLEQEKCKKILQTFAVDTVYHAAAYKHVPLVEHNPIEGIRNNVFGTLSIAQAAMAGGVKNFVLISTDKAVRPTNVMGSTKRLAELILQAFARQQTTTRFCMVRFGNVLGSSGSVVPLFRKQIMAGGPITVTHPEITRYFMTIPEAAQLVLQAGAMGEGGDVFVLDMGEPVKIVDLAKRMVHLSGLKVKGEMEPREQGSSADEGAEQANDGIEIQYVGLRPGEKLYEELLIGEDVEGTGHPLIMRAHEAEIPCPQLQGLLTELTRACDQFDYEEVRALLLRAVAGYAPQCEIEDFIWRAQDKRAKLPVVTTQLTVH